MKYFYKLKNSNVIIFSDLFEILIKYGEKKVLMYIDLIIKKLIKNKNTIILPAFNFDFTKTNKVSNNMNEIQTGFLNKYFSIKYNFKRTKKPIYNYFVKGPNCKKILSLEQNTSFGKDSVIGDLSINGSIGLGIGINPKTFTWVTLHVCEEIEKVPYRYFKTFYGVNIKSKEKLSETIFVRKKNSYRLNDGKKILKILHNKNKIHSDKYKNIDITLVNLKDFYKVGIKLLKKNKYALTK